MTSPLKNETKIKVSNEKYAKENENQHLKNMNIHTTKHYTENLILNNKTPERNRR